MRFVLITLLFFSLKSFGQCKTYQMGAKGDTLNCTTTKNMKQGKWVVHVESLRGELGYEEEGIYKDNLREGVWRTYSLVGDLMAVENYRWGNKDGLCSYFTIAGLVREESWRAINPENPYDTVEVPDVIDPYKVEMKVIKVDASTVKNGIWKYYNASTGALLKTETYVLDKLEDPNKKYLQADGTVADSTNAVKADPKKTIPKEVLGYEKKNSGKKKIKVRDGSTGN